MQPLVRCVCSLSGLRRDLVLAVCLLGWAAPEWAFRSSVALCVSPVPCCSQLLVAAALRAAAAGWLTIRLIC